MVCNLRFENKVKVLCIHIFSPRLNQIIWGSTRKEQNFSRNDLIIPKSLIVGLKNPLEGGGGLVSKYVSLGLLLLSFY